MADDAQVSRELERLRSELIGFVAEDLAGRMATGANPELSAALAEAIERKADEAVSARAARERFPDPMEFAEQVIAAAATKGVRGDGARRAGGGAGGFQWVPFLIGLVAGAGIVVVAWLVYHSLQGPAPVETNVVAPASTVNELQNVAGNDIIVTQEPSTNVAAPTDPARP